MISSYIIRLQNSKSIFVSLENQNYWNLSDYEEGMFLIYSSFILSYLSHLILSYFILSCLVLSCLVLSCLILSCLILSYLVMSCLNLSCHVFSCLVLSCLVLSCLVLSSLVLSFARRRSNVRVHCPCTISNWDAEAQSQPHRNIWNFTLNDKNPQQVGPDSGFLILLLYWCTVGNVV